MSLTEEDKRWISQLLDEKLERLETKLDEKLEHLEMKLLTAFHSWTSPMEARQRTHTTALKAIDAEMEYLRTASRS